jgi:ABC-type transporter Mla MlaB component
MAVLRMHTENHGGGCTVHVVGPLTHPSIATLHDQLRRLLGNQPSTTVELDLRCCTNIDIDGLLALDVAHQAAGMRGRELRLVQVPPLIERLIRQHNLDHLLDTDQHRAGTADGSTASRLPTAARLIAEVDGPDA